MDIFKIGDIDKKARTGVLTTVHQSRDAGLHPACLEGDGEVDAYR